MWQHLLCFSRTTTNIIRWPAICLPLQFDHLTKARGGTWTHRMLVRWARSHPEPARRKCWCIYISGWHVRRSFHGGTKRSVHDFSLVFLLTSRDLLSFRGRFKNQYSSLQQVHLTQSICSARTTQQYGSLNGTDCDHFTPQQLTGCIAKILQISVSVQHASQWHKNETKTPYHQKA